MDGPASQVSMPPSAAATRATATTGVSQPTWKCEKNASNACITPAVRLSWSDGTTQLMASAGRMKISSTSPMARNIDRGYSLAGFFSDETWTAFISMPE